MKVFILADLFSFQNKICSDISVAQIEQVGGELLGKGSRKKKFLLLVDSPLRP